jgi:hypothetical protein
VDQDQATDHFPDRHRLLLTVGDASVGRALYMEPKKIIVLRYYDTAGGGGELKVRHIGRADQAGSAAVITSILRRRRPAAMWLEMCSSR